MLFVGEPDGSLEGIVKREIKVHQLRGLRVHHSLVELL